MSAVLAQAQVGDTKLIVAPQAKKFGSDGTGNTLIPGQRAAATVRASRVEVPVS